MVVAVRPGAGSGQRGDGQHSSAPSQRTDSTLPQRKKLPSGVQRYPLRPIILLHLQRGCIRGHLPHLPRCHAVAFYTTPRPSTRTRTRRWHSRKTDGGDLFFSPQHRSSQRRSSHRRSSQRQTSQRQPSKQTDPEPGGGVRFRYRRSANPKPNPNPAVACASAPPVCQPEAEPEQHLLSGDVTTTEDQRSPSADQGLPQRTSGTPCEPVSMNPNPVVACASAPPVSEPEADFLQRWRGLPLQRPV
jgi:hypothetical protein